MSEAKFTKGPWRPEFKNIGYVQAENGAVIAKCQRLTSLCNLQANAHLIATAPELYEALNACLDLILSQEMQDGFESQQGHMARAALAKARGEA
ncbi:hypothetical protein [Gluconobacter thailandicus]|uniref:Uncharacterized protein n=1 Tax=Gluconobacter thailandicus TaxID=257438 RepID=A0AAP9JIV7_GLUTH|nr:hypothetical protein [Gluconobacter thailandicus]QEH97325.1 hypothetical protein FXF46_14485 [Gluconobacter thailandicus]